MIYDGEPVVQKDFKNNFPVVGGQNGINCLNLFDAENDSNPVQKEAPVGSIFQCLNVDIYNASGFELFLKNFTAAVEFEGNFSVKGGLIDTTDANNPKSNVGPMQVSDNDGPFVGTPEVSITGNDQHLEYSKIYPNIHLDPLSEHVVLLVLDILDVQELVGNKIRCVFRANPTVVDSTNTPLDPAVVGPKEDIVGSWITLTK
jgi:hypothetical protein